VDTPVRYLDVPWPENRRASVAIGIEVVSVIPHPRGSALIPIAFMHSGISLPMERSPEGINDMDNPALDG
jgi:hypothetical protein